MSDTPMNPNQRYSTMGSTLIEYRQLKRQVANPDEMVKRAMRKAEQMGWPDQMDVEEVEQSVRGLVFAALGIEDTE